MLAQALYGLQSLGDTLRVRQLVASLTSCVNDCQEALKPQHVSMCLFAGLKIRSTNIIDISQWYFGLVLGCIDADLCKYILHHIAKY